MQLKVGVLCIGTSHRCKIRACFSNVKNLPPSLSRNATLRDLHGQVHRNWELAKRKGGGAELSIENFKTLFLRCDITTAGKGNTKNNKEWKDGNSSFEDKCTGEKNSSLVIQDFNTSPPSSHASLVLFSRNKDI